MPPRIVVTGIGMVTSIGNGIEETLQSLLEGRTGIGPITILDTIHKQDLMAGEVKHTYDELLQLADVNPSIPWSRTALLGLIAAREAIQDARLNAGSLGETGLVSATTVGGMDRSELYYESFLKDDLDNPFIDTHHAGDHTERIAETLGIGGVISTISTACSSSLNSIMFGARLIRNGQANRVIAGGTDALSKFTLNGFNTLMILDKEQCRPFDATRQGLNLGEGAAYLVLETAENAIAAGKKIYAEIIGFANANDAFHQTASSEEGVGPYLAMHKALKMSGLKPDEIDYINVHGTGTDNNDLTEGKAMKRLFGDNLPLFSSTKAYTGHTLGAAGAVEAIISLLSLERSQVFPNLNFTTPIAELEISPVTSLLERDLRNVLTNSFGFGGNDTSMIFGRLASGTTTSPEFLQRGESQNSRFKSQEVSAIDDNSNSLSDNQFSDMNSLVSEAKTPAYINGIGALAPVDTLDPKHFLTGLPEPEKSYLEILKPNYRDYINPKLLRRMSKIVKTGLVAARIAQDDSATDKPGAILTGTGMGCQEDTEKFLQSMLDNGELLLNPTAFIQSTHNTVGAQVALLSGNNNYNLTYVHRTFSFESALRDCLLLLAEGQAQNILVGGIDEVTPESWLIKTRNQFFKKSIVDPGDLLEDAQQGALAGESAAFFSISSKQNAGTYAAIKGLETCFKPPDRQTIRKFIKAFLEKYGYDPSGIDMVLMGYNGDRTFDETYVKLENDLFPNQAIAYYKHLCGEHDASAAFAMWIAARILREGTVPEIILKRKSGRNSVNNILIYNQFRGVNHSLILLEKPGNADS